MSSKSSRLKTASLYIMSLFYFAAGVAHFLRPSSYLSIMPPWLPWHLALIYLSGVFEIVSAILLIPVKTRHTGAVMVIILLIAVLPANIQMMINFSHMHHPLLWVTIVRLPVQLLLIWWAWSFTHRFTPKFSHS